jgi:hypothetical protein
VRGAGWRVRQISGELVNQRVPDLRLLTAEPPKARTIAVAGDDWLASRIDVADSTKVRNRVEFDRSRGSWEGSPSIR